MSCDSLRYENERRSQKLLLVIKVFKTENQKQKINNITTYGEHILRKTCNLNKKALNQLIFVHYYFL